MPMNYADLGIPILVKKTGALIHSVVPFRVTESLQHDVSVTGHRCWCLPRIQQICKGCAGEGCHRCRSGVVELSATDFDDMHTDVPALVRHLDR
jgi:hypothetical protein